MTLQGTQKIAASRDRIFQALTNPAVLSVFLPMLGWVCYRLYRQRRNALVPAAVTFLTLLVTLTPWMARNERVFHHFVPLRDNFWLEAWVGNSGDTSHWFPQSAHPSTNDTELAEYNRLGEWDYMAHKRSQALAFITRHPGAFFLTTLGRIMFTWTGYWSLDRDYLKQEPLDPPNIFLCTTLTVLALLGLRRALRADWSSNLPYMLVLFAFPLIYYITSPEVYYRRPIDPFVVILAVVAVLPAKKKSGHLAALSSLFACSFLRLRHLLRPSTPSP